MHGKIYSKYEALLLGYQPHPNCRCLISYMNSIEVGYATKDGKNGADYWLKTYGKLPDYYISFAEAEEKGWQRGDSPSKYFEALMLGSKIYQNSNGHLPCAPGRIWYEADINYYSGKRNKHRILYSNDGLMFVTYDHYRTFYEITLEGVVNYETENNSKSNRFYRM